ncbi:hypothetical protein A11Q_163 [Pseudobdellovibrio exovorus JSS]|uniref:Uncharacterized protein n=2 Tax=Pseudobdellovibrio exovorus TaxID=453816 RepID=M4V5C1_9BACT|nr:hypothetical protein A11Q_163 [Pseudobdellovibrio exovorus JSS]
MGMKAVLTAVVSLTLFATSAQANMLLKDVGIIGLMSHDIFAWDRPNEVNTENGRLDLSTIFDYDGGKLWESGGNPKNAENAPVYTVTMDLVDFYKARLAAGDNAVQARQATVVRFHAIVIESYTRVMSVTLPNQISSELPNNTEQAALRAMHDILPGRIELFDRIGRKELVLTNFFTAKTRLNEKEMNQQLRNFDGDYDAEYKRIEIPFTGKVINLMDIDREFIEKFSPYRQSEMLADLAAVGRAEKSMQQVHFASHLTDLFSKAFCSKGNAWMPQEIPCH